MTNEKNVQKNIKRGIVTLPGKVIEDTEFFKILFDGSQLPLEMLYMSLYWDEMVIPLGRIQFALPFEAELMQYGILTRPKTHLIRPPENLLNEFRPVGGTGHELYAFGEIAKQKINIPGEDWVIQHYSNPMYMPEHRNKQNNIRLRINNILPMPSITETFNFEDLLEFKFRRKDQLGELHQSMDELLKKIYLEPIPAIREAEIKRFENAVKELDKPLIERFKVIRKSDWEVSLSPDIPTLLENARNIAAGIAIDGQLNMNFPIASSIASIASMLSITKKYGYTFNQFAKDDIKLEYISGAKSENIIL